MEVKVGSDSIRIRNPGSKCSRFNKRLKQYSRRIGQSVNKTKNYALWSGALGDKIGRSSNVRIRFNLKENIVAKKTDATNVHYKQKSRAKNLKKDAKD